MSKGSHAKGASFERRISKLFNQHWGIQLVRTPLSGGWGHAHTKGDLVDPSRKFPYFVECKNQQSWNLWAALFEGRGPILTWWYKAAKQAKQEKRIPLLVIGQDYQAPLVLVSLLAPIGSKPHATIRDDTGFPLRLMRFADFLKYYKHTLTGQHENQTDKEEKRGC